MEYIGIDVHKRDSQVCILGEKGVVDARQQVLSAPVPDITG